MLQRCVDLKIWETLSSLRSASTFQGGERNSRCIVAQMGRSGSVQSGT